MQAKIPDEGRYHNLLIGSETLRRDHANGGIKMHVDKVWRCAKIAVASIALLSSDVHAQELDEVAQLKKFKAQLGAWLDESNTDTRFIVDRNDKGAFSPMYNVGVIHEDDPNDPNKSFLRGTATVISDCYALTSYHVIEGLDFIDGTKMPENNKRVKLSYGAKAGSAGGFLYNGLDVTVVDPGILDLNDRKWANDFVLVRFSQKLKPGTYQKIQLGTLAGRSGINSSDTTAFESQFFIAAGYPGSKFRSFKTANLYADFCNPKGSIKDLGIQTNCVLTPGMSGGPLFIYEKIENSNRYSKILVAVHIRARSTSLLEFLSLTQPSSDTFSKKSNDTSIVAGLTPSFINKIKKYTDQDLDDTCH